MLVFQLVEFGIKKIKKQKNLHVVADQHRQYEMPIANNKSMQY